MRRTTAILLVLALSHRPAAIDAAALQLDPEAKEITLNASSKENTGNGIGFQFIFNGDININLGNTDDAPSSSDGDQSMEILEPELEIPKSEGPVALAIFNNAVVDTLPLSKDSFPLPVLPKEFPISWHQSRGGAINDGKVPLLCGGQGPKDLQYDKCFRYSTKTRAWTESGRMSEGKSHHAASVHPEMGLVITGGWLGGGRRTATVEATKDGKHFSKDLPSLPEPLSSHCQVTVNANIIMVFGGATARASPSDTALKLNVAERKWKKLPRLPTGRHGLSCGLVKEQGVPKKVVVNGGWKGSGLNKVEVLDLNTLTWNTGASLPQRLSWLGTVQFGNTFYILGGYNDNIKKDFNTIYKYEPRTGHWTLMPYHLSRATHGFPAFAVNRKAFMPKYLRDCLLRSLTRTH